MSIVLIGMKGCGKTTVGMLLAQRLSVPFIDSDAEIEKVCQQELGETLPFRQIFARYGEDYFHTLESKALGNIARASEQGQFVLSCGGRTPLFSANQALLHALGEIIFLNAEKRVLLQRILANGIPAFFPYPEDAQKSLDVLLAERLPIYQQCADVVVDIAEEAPAAIVSVILGKVKQNDAD